MNKVLKLQRIGLMTPTAVEYKGKILATNQLDIESTCNLWRNHFGFYPTERVDLAMTEKDFSVIQQKPLASSKSVYELFCEQNFIPRVFEITEKFAEWGIYRNNEVDALKTENAALRERLEKSVELPVNIGDVKYLISSDKSCVLEEKVIAVQVTKYEYNIEVDEIDTKNQYGTIESFKIKQWNGDMFFKTREEAEARLAELKGEER